MGSLLLPIRDAIKIESEPSGSAVYVLGKQVGVTPLTISSLIVFPVTYPKEMESLYGKVTLKKAGCADLTRQVTPKIMDVGLHAQLDCGSMNPETFRTYGDTPSSKETVEKRLERIKNLLDKGLITEEEAKKARDHVLNEL